MTPMLRREANEAFRRTLTRTILLPLGLLATLAVILFFLINNLLLAASWVEHTEQVIAGANQLQTTIIDQETGVHGYLLTNNPAFLEPYTAASAVVNQRFTALANLVADNPPQVTRLDAIRKQNQDWQAYALEALARKTANTNYADFVAEGTGKRIVDQMRVTLGEFIATEEQLRAVRTTTAQRTTAMVLGGSIVAALLLGAVLAYATRRALLTLSHTYNTAFSKSEANERELYTQREWFQSTLSSIGDAVVATDARGNVSFMNAVAETLTGWTRDQALGKPLADVFHIINEYTHEPAEIPVERVLREGVVIGLANHTMLVRPDGTSMPIDDSAAPVRDANGVLVGAVLVFRDISERSANEQNLRASEQRYRDLTETIPVAIFTARSDGVIEYYNQRWLNEAGIALEQVLAEGWQHHIYPADLPYVAAEWQRSIETGVPMEIEFRFRRADGAFRWQLARAEPVRDPYGRITQWIGSNTDIEDRKHLTEQIATSERRYRDLTESMQMLVWTAQPDGNVDYFNNYWFAYSGLDPNDSKNWDWGPAIHPDDLAGLIERWTHSLTTCEPFTHEFRLRRADGSFRWYLTQATLQYDDNGAPSKWYGSAIDIDDKRSAEDDLRESEAAFRQMTESMPQLVWTTHPDGSQIYFNQRWYDFTGTTLESIREQGSRTMLHPDDYELIVATWAQARATGEPFVAEYRIREAATGAYPWFLVRAVAIRDAAGQVIQWFGTCTEIEEQKRVEVELRTRGDALVRATAALEERNRELDQFAYVTSHDLKAPLRGIANLSQWIEEDLAASVTEDVRTQFQLLRGRVHRMEGLIDGILQYSRIGRVKNLVERVDLNKLLADTVDLLAPEPPMTVSIAPNMPTIQSERIHLQQVFQNLISNAFKHGQRPDVHVEVSYRDLGNAYEFSVRDNGPGIAAQYHDKIFVIFQTLASRDKVEGTGLGLSLVKKMVELHGGRIWLESAEGAGATFRFTWPKSA